MADDHGDLTETASSNDTVGSQEEEVSSEKVDSAPALMNGPDLPPPSKKAKVLEAAE